MAIFRDDKHYPYPTIHWVFACSALVLLGVSVWMILDEYSAQWKKIQRRAHQILFQKRNKQEGLTKKEQNFRSAIKKVEAKKKTFQKKLDRELQNVEFETVSESVNSFQELNTLATKLKGEVERAQKQLDKASSMITEKNSFMMLEKNKKGKTERYRKLKKEKEQWQKKYEQKAKIVEEKEEQWEQFQQERNTKLQNWTWKSSKNEDQSLDQRFSKYKSGNIGFEKLVQSLKYQELKELKTLLTQELTLVKKEIQQYDSNNPIYQIRNAPILDYAQPSLQIKQKVLDHFKDDYEFAQVRKVDRCQTCHFFIDKPGFEDQPQPYQTHPKLNLFIGASSPHPGNEYGCTICHQGRGRSLHFARADHSTTDDKKRKQWKKEHDWQKQHHWERPMIPQKYIQSSCQKCHEKQESVPFASKLNRGKKLVQQKGCVGCHNIEGLNDTPKKGPSLKHVRTKIKGKDWMYRWIRKPSAFRYNNMPQFFGLVNDQENEKFSEYNKMAIKGITEYLWQKSTRPDNWKPLPDDLTADAEEGKHLFETRGCTACHAVGKDADWYQNKENFTRSYGPDLQGLARKTNREWIYNWIRNPKKYHPETQMPNLYLTKQEALDITEYLASAEPFKEIRNEEKFQRDVPEVDNDTVDELIRKFLLVNYSRGKAKTFLNLLDQPRLSAEDRNTLSNNGPFGNVVEIGDPESRKLTWIGERIIQMRGCHGCHKIKGFEDAGKVGASLSGSNSTGSKPLFMFSFGNLDKHTVKGNDKLKKKVHKHPLLEPLRHNRWSWIKQKLKAPTSFDFASEGLKYRARLKMPRFELSNEEREAIVTFLMGQTNREIPHEYTDTPTGKEAKIEEGERIMRQKNCISCHNVGLEESFMPISNRSSDVIAGEPREGSVGQDAQDLLIAFMNEEPWLAAHLLWNPKKQQASYKLHMSERDEETLKARGVEIIARKGTFLNDSDLVKELWKKGFNQIPVYGRYEGAFADAQPEQNSVDNPPHLTEVGNRIQANWLFNFLKNPKKHRYRTGLYARMPNYALTDDEVLTLSKFFYARNDEPYPYQTEHPYVEDLTKSQEQAAVKVLQACHSCHGSSTNSKPAPALYRAKNRVKRDFLSRWLKDPLSIQPGSAMATSTTRQYINDNLGDHDEKVLVEYLMQLTREEYEKKVVEEVEGNSNNQNNNNQDK